MEVPEKEHVTRSGVDHLFGNFDVKVLFETIDDYASDTLRSSDTGLRSWVLLDLTSLGEVNRAGSCWRSRADFLSKIHF
jgi:hypothetical protein